MAMGRRNSSFPFAFKQKRLDPACVKGKEGSSLITCPVYHFTLLITAGGCDFGNHQFFIPAEAGEDWHMVDTAYIYKDLAESP